jgi:hypothetical protein
MQNRIVIFTDEDFNDLDMLKGLQNDLLLKQSTLALRKYGKLYKIIKNRYVNPVMYKGELLTFDQIEAFLK